MLIPARNEADSIDDTIKSIKRQTRAVDRIIVVANNCTDHTAAVAARCGADVWGMTENRHMKAGALNFALERIVPNLSDNDCILVMDADTTLSEDLVEKCLECFCRNPRAGAVSSIFTGRPCRSLLGTLQAMEYWRYRRQILRNGGRAFVLTGTASLFRVKTLRDIKAGRLHGSLPNFSGSFYDTFGRTEDNEITLAALKLGYDCPAADAFSQTDVMETVGRLIRQRERWYHGALINLKAYGRSLPWFLRWVYWRQQAGLFLSLLLLMLIALTIFIHLAVGAPVISGSWAAAMAILAAERTATVWPLGWRARIIALAVIPEQIYSMMLMAVFGLSLKNFLTNANGKWHIT